MFSLIKKLKTTTPLILNITNSVTQNLIADGLLALGASPIMSNSIEDSLELIKHVDAVVINIGTLDSDYLQLAHAVCLQAMQLKKPIILDPVGVHATDYRKYAALELLTHYPVAIIRGNADEIRALAGMSSQGKGVDSQSETNDAVSAGIKLAKQFNVVIVVSGEIDRVISKTHVEIISGGSPLLTLISGGGCLLTACIAAVAAIHDCYFTACVQALQYYAHCAEIAEQETTSPGSFKIAFIDQLHGATSCNQNAC